MDTHYVCIQVCMYVFVALCCLTYTYICTFLVIYLCMSKNCFVFLIHVHVHLSFVDKNKKYYYSCVVCEISSFNKQSPLCCGGEVADDERCRFKTKHSPSNTTNGNDHDTNLYMAGKHHSVGLSEHVCRHSLFGYEYVRSAQRHLAWYVSIFALFILGMQN